MVLGHCALVGLAALWAVHAGPCRLSVLTPGWPSTSWGGRSSPQLPCCPLSSQHFVCAKCEKPFLGHRHYEKKGLAYCETHYNQVGPGGRQWRAGPVKPGARGRLGAVGAFREARWHEWLECSQHPLGQERTRVAPSEPVLGAKARPCAGRPGRLWPQRAVGTE